MTGTLFDQAQVLDPDSLLNSAEESPGSSSARTSTSLSKELAPELAPELKPATRLLEHGAQTLSSAELACILMGSNEAEVMKKANELVLDLGGIAGLRSASYDDLAGSEGAGLTKARACKLLAAVELGTRIAQARTPRPEQISKPGDVHRLLESRLGDLMQEHLVALLLDTKNGVLASPTITMGTVDTSLIHAREIFRPAIKAAATNVILAHNHPSGDTKPSPNDVCMTRKIVEAGKAIDIPLLDHVIVSKDGFSSMNELGMLG